MGPSSISSGTVFVDNEEPWSEDQPMPLNHPLMPAGIETAVRKVM